MEEGIAKTEPDIRENTEAVKALSLQYGTGSIDAYQYSPLTLAYIGDSVLDLMVKTYFVKHVNKQTYKYHKDVTAIVKAVNQAQFADSIIGSLSEDEADVYKRGRNTTTHSRAKNATMSEYRKATGLEALFGYLYLKGDMERLSGFVEQMIDAYLNRGV